ncbi:glycosyltransferase [Paenibacillus turpanensis]|uniref:glycosyltransferase n=1 Tax=Paenibacillus turpanensis TaxID=2689078 RepID=UPI001409A92F|nr:glycosyltransferase [Paenibacillus turpanensis]
MLPRVSIVIPFYNDPYVGVALQSAVSQNYPNYEVLLVNDGATMYLDRITPFTDRINVISKPNGGTATALNEGIQHASGEYIAWLSSDDEFHPDKLNNQIKFMLEHNSSLSCTNFDQINEHGAVIQPSANPTYPSPHEFYRTLKSACPVNGCTVIMRKQLLTHVGLFNPVFRYTHDYELWCRALVNGYDIHFLNQPLTRYRVHGGMGTKRHWPVIQREISRIKHKYRKRLQRLYG